MTGRLPKLLAILSLLVLLFSGLMVVTYTLPSSLIEGNVQTSLAQLDAEGYDFVPYLGLLQLMADNRTDALILNQSLNPAELDPLRAAFGNYMRVNATTWDPQFDQIESLSLALAGEGGELESNARYWHGAQVFVRPMLIFLGHRAIRYTHLVLIAALVVVTALLVRYRLGLKAMFALLAALLLVGAVVVPMSIAYVSVWVIALVGVAVVARLTDSGGMLTWDLEVFLVLGALTAFFDLMSAPLLTLGMPLAALLIARLQAPNEPTARAQVLTTAKLSAAWLFGYAGSWLAKWMLSTLLTQEGILSDAGNAALYHVSEFEGAGLLEGIVAAVSRNVAMLFPLFGVAQVSGPNWSAIVAVGTALGLATLALAIVWARHRRRDGRWRLLLGLMPLALLPYLRYVLLVWHSAFHYYFSYRSQAITVFLVVYAFLYLFDPGYLQQQKRRLEASLRP
jgi:hypothetical protein